MSKIMLAKPFDKSKLEYPVEITVKLDGVAADFFFEITGWKVQSRQGKPLPSVEHIVKYLNTYATHLPVGAHIIGELTVQGVEAFKDAGGIIRRDTVDESIVLNIYDMYVPDSTMEYGKRKIVCESLATGEFINVVPYVGTAFNEIDLDYFTNIELPDLLQESVGFEGFVMRNTTGENSVYKKGKRSWGMMKYKPKPTLDLKVHSFEEATANKEMVLGGTTYQKDDGLGMVGRINVHYKGEVIGAGPGTLTHVERKALWEKFITEGDVPGDLIAEIEYMPDPNYTALRQPVFKHWRTDKTEPNEE